MWGLGIGERRLARAAAIIVVAAMAGVSCPADAADGMGQIAQAGEAITFDIPAQDLNDALLAFADKTGIQLFYDSARLAGRKSSGVQGAYTPEQALRQLLEGSGITYRFTSGKTVTVELAPDPSTRGAIQLGTITTLGTRRTDAPLSNIPASITVLDKEDVAQEQPTAPRMADILARKVPGFNPTNNGVRQIRGRTAQVFINGVPVNEQLRAGNGSDINLISPDQVSGIEVGRGANSAYGFGSPGGIIALTTPRADSEELTFNTKVGSSFNPHHPNGSIQTNLYQDVSQILGDFDFHVGAALGYDGLEFAPDGDPALGFNGPSLISNSKEFLSGLDASLGYDFGDAGSVRLTGTFSYADVLEGYEIDGTGVYRQIESNILRYQPSDDTYRQAYTVNFTYENPDILGSAVKLELLTSNIETQAFFANGPQAIRTYTINQYHGFRSSVTTPFDELLAGLSATYGFDYLRNRHYGPSYVDGTGELFTYFSPEVVLETYAPYLQVDLPIDDLHFTAGVRHEWYRGNAETATGSGGIQGGNINPFQLTLFNAGVVYSPIEQIDLFATFSQGAEISELGRAARNAGVASNIAPQPAKSNQYEIGLRGSASSVDYGLSAFFTESELLSSLQIDPANPTGPLIPLREPRMFWGVEGSLDWRIDEQWGVGGVLTWYDGVRELPNGDTRPIGSRDVPPLLFSSYVNYAPYDWWRNRLQLDFRASRDPFDGSTAYGDGRVDSVALLHLAAAFDVGPGELRLGVRNLLNEKYFSIPAEADNFGFLWIPEEGTRVSLSYAMQW